MEYGLKTDLFRAGGCRSSRVPSSGQLADRGGNSALTPALSPRRGSYRSSLQAIALLLLPFSTVRAPRVAAGRVLNRETAAEKARRWRRTIRPRQPFLPVLGERAGVRAELPSSLPSTSPTAGNGMTPVPIRPPLLGEIVAARSARVRAELSARFPHPWPLSFPCSIRV